MSKQSPTLQSRPDRSPSVSSFYAAARATAAARTSPTTSRSFAFRRSNDLDSTIRSGRFQKLEGYGNRSFARTVNDEGQTAPHLGLPVIPSQLRCRHAWLFLKTFLDLIDFMELDYAASAGMPGEKVYSIVELAVEKNGETVRFAEVIRQLQV